MGFLFIYLFFIPLWCWNTISNVEKDIWGLARKGNDSWVWYFLMAVCYKKVWRVSSMLSIFTASALLQHCKANNKKKNLNPLNPSISMHILHTALYTYIRLLMRIICLTIKSLLSGWSFPMFDSVVLIHREIRF